MWHNNAHSPYSRPEGQSLPRRQFFLGRVALKLVVTKLVGVKLVIKFVAIYASGGKLLQEATGSLR